jgi:hypothetical protein
MERRTRLVLVWASFGLFIGIIVLVVGPPLAVAWRCYQTASEGERAEAELLDVRPGIGLVLQVVSGSAAGRSCTVRPSEAPPGLATGDVLAIVVPPGRPGECVLVSTIEASSAFLWAFTSAIVAIVLLALLFALVVHRRQTENGASMQDALVRRRAARLLRSP